MWSSSLTRRHMSSIMLCIFKMENEHLESNKYNFTCFMYDTPIYYSAASSSSVIQMRAMGHNNGKVEGEAARERRGV